MRSSVPSTKGSSFLYPRVLTSSTLLPSRRSLIVSHCMPSMNQRKTTESNESLHGFSDTMPLTTMPSYAQVWLTAYQLLCLVGHVEAGDVVLVHAGASGVGTACIQIIKALGATCIITCSKAKIAKVSNLSVKLSLMIMLV